MYFTTCIMLVWKMKLDEDKLRDVIVWTPKPSPPTCFCKGKLKLGEENF